jgi:hypothetical protein
MYLGRDRFARLDPCPNGERCFLYTVVKGDSIKDIAARYAITQDAISQREPDDADADRPGPGAEAALPGLRLRAAGQLPLAHHCQVAPGDVRPAGAATPVSSESATPPRSACSDEAL